MGQHELHTLWNDFEYVKICQLFCFKTWQLYQSCQNKAYSHLAFEYKTYYNHSIKP